jgi:predicted glycosyltransferase
MYSQDGFGLGHMRRTHSIAGQLLQVCPDAQILTLSDSRLGEFFSAKRNHDYLKLPSIVKVGPGDWRAVSMALPFVEMRALRTAVIRSAVQHFRPHILLVDHMPHGAMGELLSALAMLKATGAPTKIVLGLRDILDAPAVVQHRWMIEGAYQTIEHYYDLVLVYGLREVFDLAEQYQFPPAVANRLRYCGYVCTSATAEHADGTRAHHLMRRAAGTRLIVSMAGGGDDAYPMMRALLDALPTIRARQRCVLVLIVGPFMPPEAQRDLQERARHLPVCILPSVDDTPSYIAAADLVVAMAGYNTTVEILRSGRQAILIPRAGPSAEQRMRARLFAAQGWITMLDPDDLGVENVAQTVLKSLRQEARTTPPPAPMVAGLSRVVEQLLALLPPDVAGLSTVAPAPAAVPQPDSGGAHRENSWRAQAPLPATDPV